MAEKDIAEKAFIALNDVFADIFNVLVFSGKQIVAADALEDLKTSSQYKADDGTLHEQERDTHKLWRGYGMDLVLVGIENQTVPDKDMPFRIIGYDGASYRSQLLKTEPRIESGDVKQVPVKERYPVITIVLYFGKEEWKYPVSLMESFNPPLPDNEITEVLKNYIQDYKVHVMDIPRLPMETVRMFQSDFRVVAEHFVNMYTNPAYTPERAQITHVDEFLKLMKVLTKDERYGEDPRLFIDGKKEGVKVMDYVLEYREEKGRREGRAEALFALIDALKDVYTDKEDIYQRVISYESYRNLSREDVFKYL